MTSGSSSKGDSPVRSTSNAGSRSRSSARASRSAVVRRALRAGDTVPTWLARSPRRPRVERAAERERDLGVAVPAEVDHRALGREQVERALQAGRRRARVHDEVAARRRRRPARAKPTPSAPATAARPGSTSTSVTSTAGNRASRRATQQPTMPAPTTAIRSPTSGGGVPQRVDGGLDGAGEHGARRRHVVGHDGHGAGRHDVGRLVRVQAEDGAPAQLGRPVLDDADVQVAVLDRPREVALLERRAHRGVLARRHAAPEHQRLGAAADAGAQRADDARRRGPARAARPGGSPRARARAARTRARRSARLASSVYGIGLWGVPGRPGGLPRQTFYLRRSFPTGAP